MEVKILEEAGYENALRGMAYSYFRNDENSDEWWDDAKERAFKRAKTLASKDGGHNKFLESIILWIDVNATRAFWSEMDTYRVGMTKQSTSSMHTLNKRPPLVSDFEIGTPFYIIQQFHSHWEQSKDDICALKHGLPESFMQRRILCTNYKTIRNIISQRKGHRYKYWGIFIDGIMSQLEHPELVEDLL
jgi:hypothetical protein